MHTGVVKSDETWCLNYYLLPLQQILGLDPVIGRDDNVNLYIARLLSSPCGSLGVLTGQGGGVLQSVFLYL